MITISQHKRYLRPDEVHISAEDGAVDDLLQIFYGTGLDVLVKRVEFRVTPLITRHALEDLLLEDTDCLRKVRPERRILVA